MATIDRRFLLKSLAALSGSAFSTSSWSQADALTLGVISQFSGTYASFGTGSLQGARLAVEERNGQVLGRRINLLDRDDEGKAPVGVRWLTDLVQNRNLKYFVSVSSSAVGLAESDVAKREKVLQFVAGGSDEFTGGRCSDYTFQWSAHPYTACYAMLEYVRKQHPTARRVYALVADYTFGHALQKYSEHVAKELGFEIVGLDRHAFGERQYTQFFNKAVAARPDLMLMLTAGSDFLSAMRQWHGMGMKNVVVAAPWAAELPDLLELTPEMRAGLLLGLNYHPGIENATNKAFVVQSVRRFKMAPTYGMAAGYDAFRTIFAAMDKSKSVDPTTLAKTIEGLEIDSVLGKTRFDAKTHQHVRPYFVALCRPAGGKSDEVADVVWQSGRPQPPALNACKR